MYYCYCIDYLLSLSTQIPKILRIIDYNKYNLSFEEKADLLQYCGIWNPLILNEKCIFPNEALCMSGSNNFYLISDITNILHPPQFVDSMNYHIELTYIMTYKSSWIKKFYYEPFQSVLQSLNPILPSPLTTSIQLTTNQTQLPPPPQQQQPIEVERVENLETQLQSSSDSLSQRLLQQQQQEPPPPSSNYNSIAETHNDSQIQSRPSQPSEVLESYKVSSNAIHDAPKFKKPFPSLKIHVKDLSKNRNNKHLYRQYSSGNSYEDGSLEYLYSDDCEDVYEYIQNKQPYWLCFLANKKCIRIYVYFIIIVIYSFIRCV